jgi:hypothetical protein
LNLLAILTDAIEDLLELVSKVLLRALEHTEGFLTLDLSMMLLLDFFGGSQLVWLNHRRTLIF